VRRLKLTLGILMIAALFVPLSECSRGGKTPATPTPPRTLMHKVFPRSDAQTDYDYGATRLGLSISGVATLVAFGWPLAMALLNRRIAGKRHAWILYVLELLLCAGTIYWIHIATLAGKRLWGTYFVFTLMVAYAIAALVDLASGWRHKFARQTGF
jgi:hypothetical protein